MDKKEIESEFLRRVAEDMAWRLTAEEFGLNLTEEESDQAMASMLGRLKQAVTDAESKGLIVEGVEFVLDGPLRVVSGHFKLDE